MITVNNVAPVKTGQWLIVYTHSCECGCTEKRFNFVVNKKTKPTNPEQLANADHDKR